MNYALRMLVTGKRTKGDVKLANVRLCGGDWAFVVAAQSDAMQRLNDPLHPISKIATFTRAMNNEFGATAVVFRINEEPV